MPDLVRKIDFASARPESIPTLLRNQWLVTNGLGGFASGTLSGEVTWKYHGLLVAALPSPEGRTLMLNHLAESVRRGAGPLISFAGASSSSPSPGAAANYLVDFWLENQQPHWRYRIGDLEIEKRLLMLYLQNTVHISYTLRSAAEDVTLELRPSMHFRPFESAVGRPLGDGYEVRSHALHYEIVSHEHYPPLRLILEGGGTEFTNDGGSTREIFYERDAARGYDARGPLWSPGFFSAPLHSGQTLTFIASTESWHTLLALDPEAARSTEQERRRRLLRIAQPAAQVGVAAELVLAADQFIISPAGRIKDAARARAAGDELRSVIAGYHWFTDWGRDTMISLDGLTLVTGRHQEAAWILRTFAQYVRDGLIPNLFPEGRNEGLYHTADATLWFFHAIHRYEQVTRDHVPLQALLPVLRDIVERHLAGTKFGIGVDPDDGLLREGQEGYQLTWMDAKVGDWVVTPRRGKAVEINALWYNALRLLEGWMRSTGETAFADQLGQHAARAQASFNARFWNEAKGCLYDVVDGEKGRTDDAVRPNQVMAISLSYPVLAPERWEPVLHVVKEKLLTPLGLRSLSPDHPDYKVKYSGDLRARDAAYHQGTVWAWLIGPFIDAWLRVHPDHPSRARKFLEGFESHLNDGCVGSISEIFDAEAPYTERGCIAQAWSVAEVLRCYVRTAGSEKPLKAESD